MNTNLYHIKKRLAPSGLGDLVSRAKKRFAFVTFLFLFFGLGSCTDKFEQEQILVYFDVDTSKLDIPAGVSVTFQNVLLTMNDYNRWSETLTYQAADFSSGILLRKGRYESASVTVDVSYTYEGRQYQFTAAAPPDGITGSATLHLLNDGRTITLALERRAR